MFGPLDAIAFLINTVVWLFPLVYNAARGNFRLMHPIGLLPLVVVYLSAVPMVYRLTDDTMLHASQAMAADPLFLAVPLFILAGCGVCYHLAVRVSGVSLKLGLHDNVFPYANFPTRKNGTPAGMFMSASIVLIIAVLLRQYVSPTVTDSTGHGAHLFNTLFMSSFLLPLLVLGQDRKLGSFFLACCFPVALLFRSKVSFILLVVGLLLFYQAKIFKISKVSSVIIVIALILTPVAVSRYASWTEGQDVLGSTSFSTADFEDAVGFIFQREYAFESFAIVYADETISPNPLGMGSNILDEFLQIIPSYLWPDKPSKMIDFPSRYLGDTWHPEMAYSKHFLTPWFLDFNIPGCFLGFFVVGLVMGYAYRIAVSASLARQESWPMILYICVAFQSHPLVGGGIPFSVTMAIGMGFGLVMALCLSAVFDFSVRLTTLGGQAPLGRRT